MPQVITRKLRLDGTFDFKFVAKRTPGFVGADLMALTKEAAAIAVTRIFRELAPADNAANAGGSSAAPAGATGSGGAAAATANGAAGASAAAPSIALPAGRFGQGPLQASELVGLSITMADFEAAIPKVQPSVRREGFTTKPDVTWEDVGSLDEVPAAVCYPLPFVAAAFAAYASFLIRNSAPLLVVHVSNSAAT